MKSSTGCTGSGEFVPRHGDAVESRIARFVRDTPDSLSRCSADDAKIGACLARSRCTRFFSSIDGGMEAFDMDKPGVSESPEPMRAHEKFLVCRSDEFIGIKKLNYGVDCSSWRYW